MIPVVLSLRILRRSYPLLSLSRRTMFTIPVSGVELLSSPKGLEKEYEKIFTKDSIAFIHDIVVEFRSQVDQILINRKIRKLELESGDKLPDFKSFETTEPSWEISPLPTRLQNRQLDLGDVSPSSNELLKASLQAKVQGIQVDFDDGHCPSWANQISAYNNILAIVNGEFYPTKVPDLEKSPLLLLRPRAWNMNEHNFIVKGREIPAPLLDFGLLMFLVGKKLYEKGCGPYFYLPKLEGAAEAELWNNVFIWTQKRLNLPVGTIKACVLIENVLAAFEAEQILYQLRHHSFGLNCGVWDYSASIINKLGARPDFVIPDRSKYVNLNQNFLLNYIQLVIHVCKKHGAPVTGGMVPFVLKHFGSQERNEILVNILKSKKKELQLGVNGFLTYDLETIPIIQSSLFSDNASTEQNLTTGIESLSNISNTDLLTIPSGGVTNSGLVKNVRVGILFIYSWIHDGKGHFVLDGAVEDSATAEISRSQVWQWIYHQTKLEDGDKDQVTKTLVTELVWKTYAELINVGTEHKYNAERLQSACEIFIELTTAYEFPEFVTTYLYNHTIFRKLQNS